MDQTAKTAESLPPLDPPERCVADFCLIPMGTASASVSRDIADIQKLLSQSGLEYSMHSAGTTVEGSWMDVMIIIGQAHALLHQKGIVRIQTDIRVGSRTDKVQSPQDKVDAVNRILAEDKQR